MAPKAERHTVARVFAKATTKVGLATTIAALWLTAVPIASAVAQGAPDQISAARAAALQQCNRLAQRYPIHEWGNTQIHRIGPAWPDMANKNDWQSAGRR
jgi:hypothetical protein